MTCLRAFHTSFILTTQQGLNAIYRTIDFIAKQPSTTISFMSWGA